MSEDYITSAKAPNATQLRLTEARHASAWMTWLGWALAVIWWIGALTGLVTYFGPTALLSAPRVLLIAGGALIAIPGLMLVMAALFAREQARSHAVNEIVLEAATLLLSPAESLSTQTRFFAEEMVKASARVERSMGHALSAMKAMATEIGEERAQLESVTYASADTARDLTGRLSLERSSLEALATDLREQTRLLNEAIPTQAEMMVQSAQLAAREVALAEDALMARLSALDETGQRLAQKISTLDTLAAEANTRNEALAHAIHRMEDKLEQSRKTVEAAAEAGELAAAAANTTGETLLASVNAALDNAKQASAEIQAQADAATQQSLAALQDLRQAGKDTAAAVRSVGMAARAEADLQAQRHASTRLSRNLQNTAHDVSSQQSPSPRQSDAISSQTAKIYHKSDRRISDIAKSEKPANGLGNSPSVTVETDLFEANADRMAEALQHQVQQQNGPSGKATPPAQPPGHTAADRPDIFDTEADQVTIEMGQSDQTVQPSKSVASGNSLSEIIADMEREERSDLSREDTAAQ